MGQQVNAGSTLVAGTAPGGLNQYYSASDTDATTVVADTNANLSSVYTIPAAEVERMETLAWKRQ